MNNAHRKLINYATLILICVGSLGVGFLIGLKESDPEITVTVDRQLRFTTGIMPDAVLDRSWGKPQPWGTPLNDRRASILFGFDGAARGDVDLLVEARTDLVPGDIPPMLILTFNGTALGTWKLFPAAKEAKRHFLIPKSVFNKGTVAHFSLEFSGPPPKPATFGLVSLKFQDLKRIRDARGFIDLCTADKIVGWAVTGDTAAYVTADVNGRRVSPLTVFNSERPDLPRHGLPIDAGFEIILDQRIDAASVVNVRFAGGRPLRGSPCHGEPEK